MMKFIEKEQDVKKTYGLPNQTVERHEWINIWKEECEDYTDSDPLQVEVPEKYTPLSDKTCDCKSLNCKCSLKITCCLVHDNNPVEEDKSHSPSCQLLEINKSGKQVGHALDSCSLKHWQSTPLSFNPAVENQSCCNIGKLNTVVIPETPAKSHKRAFKVAYPCRNCKRTFSRPSDYIRHKAVCPRKRHQGNGNSDESSQVGLSHFSVLPSYNDSPVAEDVASASKQQSTSDRSVLPLEYLFKAPTLSPETFHPGGIIAAKHLLPQPTSYRWILPKLPESDKTDTACNTSAESTQSSKCHSVDKSSLSDTLGQNNSSPPFSSHDKTV